MIPNYKNLLWLPVGLALLALAGCGDATQERESGDDATADTTDDAGGSASPDATDHGARTELGSVTLLGHELAVASLGEVSSGEEAAFEVRSAGGDTGVLRPILWLEDDAGEQVGGPESGAPEGAGWHFHVTPRAGSSPTRVVLRLRLDGGDERAGLPLDGHGHDHPATPHDGVVASIQDAAGASVGYAELKLHDDKGDLELWLAQDESFDTPLDIPADAVPSVVFIDDANRRVELRVRDMETNPDEDGEGNLRGETTNYFIFPGDTGADASWLQGKEFRALVVVHIPTPDGELKSEEFLLKPHTHDGEDH